MAAFANSMYGTDLVKYYDIMHQHRNYPHECQVTHELIQQAYPQSTRILDVGCGTGEHAIRMAQCGYQVTALDTSAAMLTRAQEKATQAGVAIDFQCTTLQRYQVSEPFHAIYCLGFTLLYVTTYPELMSFFTAAYQRLAPRGSFLVDYIQGWSLINDYPRDKFVYTDQTTSIFCFQQADLKQAERLRHIEFYYVIQEATTPPKMVFTEEHLRIFFDDEVEFLLTQSGFEGITLYHDYSLAPTTPSKDGHITLMIGRKSASAMVS